MEIFGKIFYLTGPIGASPNNSPLDVMDLGLALKTKKVKP